MSGDDFTEATEERCKNALGDAAESGGGMTRAKRKVVKEAEVWHCISFMTRES